MNDLSNSELYEKLLAAIQTESKNTKEDLKEEIKTQNDNIIHLLQQQNIKINDLEIKYNQLEQKNLTLERRIRKNNVIIFGLKINKQVRLHEFILEKLEELLQIKLAESDLNNVYQIKTDKGEPIKVELSTYLKKELILSNTYKLKGTKIFIVHDLCYNDRIDNKILREHLKLAKSKNYFAKIKGNKLVINDDIYSVEQLKRMQTGKTEETENEIPLINQRSLPNSAPATPNPSLNLDYVFAEESNQIKRNEVDTEHTSPIAPPLKRPKKLSMQSHLTRTNSVNGGNSEKRLRSSQKPARSQNHQE